MARVNTASVREEVTRVEEELAQLSAAGKVSDESRSLIKALLTIVNLLMMVFLEKTTRKTSQNSSKPSSQTDTDHSAKNTRKPSKRPAERDDVFANSRVVESSTVAEVNRCGHCGENLRLVSVTDHERRTRFDIVIETRIDHVDAQIKTCPGCQTRNTGAFPTHLAGPVQYGLGVKATVLNLLITQRVSLNRVGKLIKTLIGRAISEATLLKYVEQLHQALESWEHNAIETLLASKGMHVDETSLRVDKKNHWVHVCSAGDITLKRLHAKRGAAAMDDINIIPRYGGVIVHDCWASYFSYARCDDALCGSHLLRELEFITDSNGYHWARQMKRLLQKTCATVSARDDKRLGDTELANLQKRYRAILTRGQRELPARPVRPSGKRGRLAQSDAQNLWDRMKTHEKAILLFAKRADVPFSNNRAERDLRMGKVKQKVSGCFRREKYAVAYCRISSYLQTMAHKGYNPLVAIQLALADTIPVPKG
jgi:transposase